MISTLISMERYHGLSKRSVGIPKGFLFYSVLRLLSTTPMSGSEIAEDMEKESGWRPSPGSIYPLLSKLKDNAYAEEVESGEPGLKRFVLTAKGKELLKEYEARAELFRTKFHSIRRIWLKIYREMDEDLYQANMKLFEAIEGITPYLKGPEAKDAHDKVRSVILKASDEIEALKKDIGEHKGTMI